MVIVGPEGIHPSQGVGLQPEAPRVRAAQGFEPSGHTISVNAPDIYLPRKGLRDKRSCSGFSVRAYHEHCYKIPYARANLMASTLLWDLLAHDGHSS